MDPLSMVEKLVSPGPLWLRALYGLALLTFSFYAVSRGLDRFWRRRLDIDETKRRVDAHDKALTVHARHIRALRVRDVTIMSELRTQGRDLQVLTGYARTGLNAILRRLGADLLEEPAPPDSKPT